MDTKAALLVIALGTLAACATMEDFQAMSAAERAREVCTNSDAYRIRRKEIQELDYLIREKEELLARGYRVHEQCRRVAVPAQRGDCEGARTDEDYRACQEAIARNRTTTECFEIPVQINADVEYQQLSDYRNNRAMASTDHEEALQECLERVGPLSPEDAWRLYEDDRDR